MNKLIELKMNKVTKHFKVGKEIWGIASKPTLASLVNSPKFKSTVINYCIKTLSRELADLKSETENRNNNY